MIAAQQEVLLLLWRIAASLLFTVTVLLAALVRLRVLLPLLSHELLHVVVVYAQAEHETGQCVEVGEYGDGRDELGECPAVRALQDFLEKKMVKFILTFYFSENFINRQFGNLNKNPGNQKI
jgi:hypothetical protein